MKEAGTKTVHWSADTTSGRPLSTTKFLTTQPAGTGMATTNKERTNGEEAPQTQKC